MKTADFKGAVCEITYKSAVKNYGPAAEAGRVYIRDAGCPPLVMMITEKGNKSWLTRPRVRGASQPIKLTWDRSVSRANVSAARDWANRVADACKDGRDPRLDPALNPRKARIEADAKETFEAAAKRFIASTYMGGLRDKTRYDWTRIVDGKLVPAWGRKLADGIAREDVVALRDSLEATPRQANVALEVAHAFFRWHAALPKGAPTVVSSVAKYPETERSRVLDDDELKAVLAATRKPEAGRYGDVVHLALLTGLRHGNIVRMRREWIGDDGILRIPEEHHKNGTEHVLPLSAAALAIIRRQPVIEGSPWVFPGTRTAGPMSASERPKLAFEKLSGVTNWRFHDLRRTCRTRLGEIGVIDEIAELYVGHVRGGVKGTYDKSRRLPELKDAAERLSAHYDGIEHEGRMPASQAAE